MRANKKALVRLIKKEFSGNNHRFAQELKLNDCTISRILNHDVNIGTKTLTAIMRYCKKNNLNYQDYFFT